MARYDKVCPKRILYLPYLAINDMKMILYCDNCMRCICCYTRSRLTFIDLYIFNTKKKKRIFQ